ncbi:SGNH hydrolase [Rhypophila decipiens]|uniref:SGNH hydrolase n=1 Tax=Rhypophila decipiens TaxID=261697 RepID=A0AAN6Y526_9PEZI|nr:SGNH hydrolase [Rhypophila decipiens]
MLVLISCLPLTVAAAAAANSIIPLRILPLGASVTFGVGSSTGNSYRKDLRDSLAQAGHQVNFVGRRKNGDFADNNVEATSGFVISQIAESALVATPMFLPNIALIEAGTNNCNSGRLVPDAGANVTKMIDTIFHASPGVTVILALILKNKIAEQDACRVDINRQYTDVLAPRYQQAGAKFVLVDMRSEDGPTTADLFDTRHPNDVGYRKMAVVWNKGILAALEKRFIIAPADNGIPPDSESGAGASPQVSGGSGPMTGQVGAGRPFAAIQAAGSGRRFMQHFRIYTMLGLLWLCMFW